MNVSKSRTRRQTHSIEGPTTRDQPNWAKSITRWKSHLTNVELRALSYMWNAVLRVYSMFAYLKQITGLMLCIFSAGLETHTTVHCSQEGDTTVIRWAWLTSIEFRGLTACLYLTPIGHGHECWSAIQKLLWLFALLFACILYFVNITQKVLLECSSRINGWSDRSRTRLAC